MDKVETAHSGRFTLTSSPQPMADGKFQATFVVTEHRGAADAELKRFTGVMFDTVHEAVEGGIDAAKAWLDEFRPI
jgi:hypothetical protein